MSTQLRFNKRQKRTIYIHEQKKWLWDLYKQRFKIEIKPLSYINLVIAFVEKFDEKRVKDAIITRYMTHKKSFFDKSIIRFEHYKSKLSIWLKMKQSLHEWQLRKKQNAIISDYILKEKAIEFFQQLRSLFLHYQMIEFKTFIDWFNDYKARYKIIKRVRYDEFSKVDLK